MTQRVVYLPVEIKHRELPSRLLIAAYLLEAGCTVVLGNHWSMTDSANVAALPEGVFLYKTVNKVQGINMLGARAAGHIVAANDEEVLAFTEYNGYVAAFSEEAATACDLFLAQSAIHGSAIERRFPHLAGKILIAGNPRVALMTAENRHIFTSADRRVEKLKPYILFNTNFGIINSFWNAGGSLNMAVHEETGAFDGPDREQKKKEFAETLAWEKGNHRAMLALLRWAVENIRGMRIVVRPHPGERAEYWHQMLAGFPNSAVITQSDPHPWVLDAELLVHTGCTTGLEAALFGKPVLNLQPVDRPHYGHITNLVNPTLRTPEEAAQAIVEFLSGRGGPIAADKTAVLETYLPGYRDGTAARRMADALLKLLPRPVAAGAPLSWRGTFLDVDRTEVQKMKFTAGDAEIREGLTRALRVAGTQTAGRVGVLGDSLFMIVPDSR